MNANHHDPFGEMELPHRLLDAGLIKWVFSFLDAFRSRIPILLFTVMLQAAFGTSGALILRQAMDAMEAGSSHDTWFWTMIFLLVIVGNSLSGYWVWRIVSAMAQQAMHNMRRKVFEHIQEMDYAWFDRTPAGRIVTRATNDIKAINDLFVTGLVELVRNLLTPLFIIPYMFIMDVHTTLVCLAIVPVLAVMGWKIRKPLRRAHRDVRKKLATINVFLQENISGMKEIQAFGRESRQFEKFSNLNAQYRDSELEVIRLRSLVFPILSWTGNLSVAIVLVWTGILAPLALSAGTVVAFIKYVRGLFHPLIELTRRIAMLQRALSAAERVRELMNSVPSIEAPTNPVRMEQTITGKIELENVWMNYGGGPDVLRDISLSIAAGEKLAIVGHTGAGKSTLINLISRQYDVTSGIIRVEGHDIRTLDPKQLRRHIGVISQDVMLFNRSMRENITLGSPISDRQLYSLAKAANLSSVAQRLPAGLDTMLGERGSSLSFGERQLVALARVMFHDPEILILDEATSGIDQETENLITDALWRIMETRTTLIVAHRLSTISRADRIAVLHHGELGEMGTHDELLARNGLYRKLHDLQFS